MDLKVKQVMIVYTSLTMEHLPGYARRDWRVVDYNMYSLPNTGLWFRGPKPEALEPGRYISCIGAAQTFGCLCHNPYPSLLCDRLGLEMLNLGYGGAGPLFFLRHDSLLEYINRSMFAIIQVMSARSESNSLLDSGGLEYLTRRSDGARIGADAAYRDLLRQETRWRIRFGSKEMFFFGSTPSRIKEIVVETRRNWVGNFAKLLMCIEIPTILFYFSKRRPNYQERYRSVHALLGEFPQLVNSSMISDLKPYADYYVECVSSRGSPHLLKDRFTGKTATVDLSSDRADLQGVWKHNSYYPSPEMHWDAASILEPACRKVSVC
jgi:hypothetical protein